MRDPVALYHPRLNRTVTVSSGRAPALLRNGWEYPADDPDPTPAPCQLGGVLPQIPSWLAMPDPDLDPEAPTSSEEE